MSSQEFMVMKLLRALYSMPIVALIAIMGIIFAIALIGHEWCVWQRTWVFVLWGVVIVACVIVLVGCCWAHLGSLGPCPNCGEKVTEDCCTHCGFEVIAPMATPTCPGCGADCDTPFCSNCGAKMDLED